MTLACRFSRPAPSRSPAGFPAMTDSNAHHARLRHLSGRRSCTTASRDAVEIVLDLHVRSRQFEFQVSDQSGQGWSDAVPLRRSMPPSPPSRKAIQGQPMGGSGRKLFRISASAARSDIAFAAAATRRTFCRFAAGARYRVAGNMTATISRRGNAGPRVDRTFQFRRVFFNTFARPFDQEFR